MKRELKKRIELMLEGSKSQKQTTDSQGYAWGYQQALKDVLELLKPVKDTDIELSADDYTSMAFKARFKKNKTNKTNKTK